MGSSCEDPSVVSPHSRQDEDTWVCSLKRAIQELHECGFIGAPIWPMPGDWTGSTSSPSRTGPERPLPANGSDASSPKARIA